MALDGTNGAAPGEEQVQIETTEQSPDGGNQAGAGSPAGQGNDSRESKPLTQEAFNNLYRQFMEEKEGRQKDQEAFEAYLADLEAKRPAAPATPQPGKTGQFGDLPEEIQQAIAENPALAGSAKFVKAMYQALAKGDRDQIKALKDQLTQFTQAGQQEQIYNTRSDMVMNTGSPAIKELGLNPNDNHDAGLIALAGSRVEQQMPPEIRKLWNARPDHPMLQSWFAKAFRAELQEQVKARNAWFDGRHKAKIEELRKAKGATPPGGGGPSIAPEDPAAKQVKDAFAKGGKAVSDLRKRIFGGDED